MLSIPKHITVPSYKLLLNYYSTQLQNMNFTSIVVKILLLIAILALSALICLTSAVSKQTLIEKVNNNPARYTRGYGYHGNQQGRQEQLKGHRTRQELALPPFQVLAS